MLEIGKVNYLQVVKEVHFGVYLDGHEKGTILLPKRYVPEGCSIGQSLDVFIYLDSEDCLIATTETPLACVGDCAYLKVTDVNNIGAFLDWGLMKDLLVPYNEQHKPMEVGKSYVVYVYLDESSDRIVASSKLGRHLQEKSVYHKVNQEVDILICGKSDMGYKAVVHNTHIGLIFRDDAFKPLRYGKSMKGYIKSIRPDGKIDLSLQLPAGLGRDDLSEQIIQHLENNDGRSKLTDKSAPDDIYHHFNVSKKNYKKALGTLYKQKRISIEADQIVLLAPQAAPQPQKDPPAKPAKQQTNTPASKATNKAITKPIKKPHNHTPKPSK